MKPSVDKEKMRVAQATDRAAEAVGRISGKLTIAVLGEPKVYHALGTDEKNEVLNARDSLHRLSNALRSLAKSLRNEARGGLI